MIRGRLALLVAGPALILIGGQTIACRVASRPVPSSRVRLDAAARSLGRELDGILADAMSAALRARDATPEKAAEALRSVLASRLEGDGVIRGGRFETWAGTPAEAALYGEPGTARVLPRGIRTSLLVRSDADKDGRSGVASFVLEIKTSPTRAAELLPDIGGITTRFDFGAAFSDTTARYDPGRPNRLTWPWLDGQRRTVTWLVSEEPPAPVLSAMIRARAEAWAALALSLFVMLALARRSAPVDRSRVMAVMAGVIASRAALAGARTLEELLPRSVGSPSLYGRGDLFGLCASPAALMATTLAAWWILTVTARYAAETLALRAGRGAARALLGVGVLGGIVSIVALASSLTHDARVRVPRLDPSSPGTVLLALAAATLIVGVAEVAATLVATFGGTARAGRTPKRRMVVLAILPLSALFLARSERLAQQMTDDRLRSDFAPLVREQSARRASAVSGSVAETAVLPQVAAALSRPPEGSDAFLAFDLWMASDLFHEGFASSLDLFEADGTRRGHFGFAFPQVGGDREIASRGATVGGPPVVEVETLPAGATLLRVVHAEAAVPGPFGTVAGRVVGHVLEDPTNLPFLPGNAPYLDALGGVRADDPSAEAPDYVLFDDDGGVVLSTVHQPPAATPALRDAVATASCLDIVSGDVRYRALPLLLGGRLHVLLAPAPTSLGILADTIRLVLLAAAVLALATLGGMLPRRGGLEALLDLVRGSFYRRLLATVLLASVVPLIGLAFFLRAYIDRRGEASLADTAAALVGAARRVVEDYLTVGAEDPTVPRPRVNDETLWWLRRVVGQEIHVYENGMVAATSKPELFDSTLMLVRLPGEIDRDVVRGNQPFIVRQERLGTLSLPVAYARLDEPEGPRDAVIAVPLVIEQRAFARSVDRLVEMLLLVTTAFVLLLAGSAAWIARSVADPVRRLADASRRIAGGNYGTRLVSSSRDEMGSLVADFNKMSAALAGQRADIERRRDYIEALLAHATTGVVSTDARGRLVTINPAAEKLLSGAGPPAVGASLVDTLGASDRLKPLAATLAKPAAVGSVPVEVDLQTGEDTVRIRFVRVPLPVPDGGEEGSLILLDDVTSLMKSNQLAAWAEMARAIAHEIKNPLTPIQLSAEHIRKLLHDRGVAGVPEIDACLETIVRNVRDLRDISGAFSTYARIPDLVLTTIDAGAFLRDVAAPYRSALPPGVAIVERHAPAPKIQADGRILARAIVNLIENALQAMPQGGTLTISSGPGAPGEVVLQIEDEGVGLTQEARARLFEPYFSTKSSGTGLGLAIVQRVVAGHGGSIDVLSSPSGGTIFRIRLHAA